MHKHWFSFSNNLVCIHKYIYLELFQNHNTWSTISVKYYRSQATFIERMHLRDRYQKSLIINTPLWLEISDF